jgi:ferredoxin like protein
VTANQIDQLLSATKFEVDEENPHIVIDPVGCRTCPSDRSCETSCPAQRYAWDEDSQTMSFDYVGCLECGNCRLVCERLYNGAPGYSWNYPGIGAGVTYRFG